MGADAANQFPFGRLRSGVFEIDLRAGELTKHGLRIRLQEQPFQALAMLLDKPGELVTRELGANDRAMIWSNMAYQARFNPSILMRRSSTRSRPTPGFRIFWAVLAYRDEERCLARNIFAREPSHKRR
jgi:hypothetical protein